MQNIADMVKSLVADLGGDAQKFAQIGLNNAAYRASVSHVWKDKDAQRLILDHTNAFYVRRDEAPRKGPEKDKPYIVCEVCIDDPLIRSEMDSNQEFMKMALRQNGITFDEFRIIPARRGMRSKHPFADKDAI